MTVGLQAFNATYAASGTGYLTQAAALMAIIVPVVIFFLAQRVFMRGVVDLRRREVAAMTVRQRPEVRSGPSPYAWRRPIGIPYDGPERARAGRQSAADRRRRRGVACHSAAWEPGSIGRTHRGDFARWHLDVGRHRFETVPADQFSVYVARGGDAVGPRPLDDPARHAPQLELGSARGRRHVPRSVPQCLVRVRLGRAAGAADAAAVQPGDPRQLPREQLPGRHLRVADRESGPGAGDGRADVQLVERHRPRSWAGPARRPPKRLGPPGRPGGGAAQRSSGRRRRAMERQLRDHGRRGTRRSPVDVRSVPRRTTGRTCGPTLRPTAGWTTSRTADPAGPGEAIGAALAATVELAPGETKRVSVRPRLGSAGRRVRVRDALVQALHALLRPRRQQRLGDRRRGPRQADRVVGRDRRLAGADPGRRRRAPTGTRARCSTSSTSSSTAARSGPTASRFAPATRPTREVTRREPAADAPDDSLGHFAVLECYDYPFYNTLDVNFYASWALLLLWPDLDLGVVRDFAATVDLDDPEIVTVGWQGTSAPRKRRGALPHDLGGSGRRSVPPPEFLHLARHQHLEGPQQQVRAPGLARCPARARLPTWLARHGRPSFRRWTISLNSIGTATGCRSTTASPTRRTTCGRCGGRAPTAARSGWPPSGPRSGWVRWPAIPGTSPAFATCTIAAAQPSRPSCGTAAPIASTRAAKPPPTPIMADQLAGQWYADATQLGDLVSPERIDMALRTIYESNVLGFGGGDMGAVNGTRPDGSIDESTEQSAESWTGTTYGLAAFMIGRGLTEEGWRTAHGTFAVTYGRGLVVPDPGGVPPGRSTIAPPCTSVRWPSGPSNMPFEVARDRDEAPRRHRARRRVLRLRSRLRLHRSIGVARRRRARAHPGRRPPSAPGWTPSKSIDERVAALLGQMTLDEKIGQMTQIEKNAIDATNAGRVRSRLDPQRWRRIPDAQYPAGLVRHGRRVSAGRPRDPPGHPDPLRRRCRPWPQQRRRRDDLPAERRAGRERTTRRSSSRSAARRRSR